MVTTFKIPIQSESTPCPNPSPLPVQIRVQSLSNPSPLPVHIRVQSLSNPSPIPVQSESLPCPDPSQCNRWKWNSISCLSSETMHVKMLGSAGQGRSRWTGSLDRIVVSGQGRWTGSLDRVVAPGQGRRTTPAIVNGVKKCPMADRMYKSPSIHRLNAHAMDESGMKYLEYVRMDNALCEQKCLAYILQRLEYEK